MTYPPQQPGPGGWGQQPPGGAPGQVPQPAPNQQQQPAWYGNQHAGWAPGQQAPPPQQPPPPPDWNSAGFGQPSWIAEPNGFGEVEPPKKKSRMPWILGAVGAVVIAGGAAVVLLFFVNGGPGEAKPVAQQVVTSVNQGDFGAVREVLCQSNRSQLETELKALQQWDFDIRLGNVTENGDKATAHISGTYATDGTSQAVDQDMGLVVENGQWRVCDLDQ